MSVNNDCVSYSLFCYGLSWKTKYYEPITLQLLRRVPNLTGSRGNLLCLNPVSLGFNFDSIPAWKFSKGRRRIPELRKSSLKN